MYKLQKFIVVDNFQEEIQTTVYEWLLYFAQVSNV